MAGSDPARDGLRLTDLGRWTEQQAAEYESARAAINAVIAACSSRLGQAVAAGERAELLAEQQRYMRERRFLTLRDDEQIKRILRDYPALAREIAQR